MLAIIIFFMTPSPNKECTAEKSKNSLSHQKSCLKVISALVSLSQEKVR